jgi:transposase
VAAARAAFQLELARLQAGELVFIDESGIDTRLVRRFARAPRGERAVGRAPVGSYRRLTIVGALAAEGLLAPLSVEAAMNTDLFLAYLDQVLIPALVAKKPGAVVILDNLKPHKVPAVRAKLEAAGLRLLYLPPYSPDFSPIEPAWSKLKALLRAAAARTLPALEAALAAALDAITTADIRGWFAHCGYTLAPE